MVVVVAIMLMRRRSIEETRRAIVGREREVRRKLRERERRNLAGGEISKTFTHTERDLASQPACQRSKHAVWQ